MNKPTDDWASKFKRLLWNLFLIALFLIAIIKVLRVELHDLIK